MLAQEPANNISHGASVAAIIEGASGQTCTCHLSNTATYVCGCLLLVADDSSSICLHTLLCLSVSSGVQPTLDFGGFMLATFF